MKTLGKLKLCTISALIVLGMSSCLKHDESLNVAVQSPYILQNDYGYIPQIRLQCGQPLQSASINVAGKKFDLKALNSYVWEVDGYGLYNALDSVPTGYSTVNAIGTDGKTADLTIGFYATTKKIGAFDVTSLKYDDSKGEVSVTLADTVKNANAYYWMIKVPVDDMASKFAMWVPYNDLQLDKNLSATESGINKNKLAAGTYRFTIGAGYGTTLRIYDNYISVIIK